MWPVNEQHMKAEDRGTPEEPGEGAEGPPADTPTETDERTPEEAGYGHGV